MHKLTDTNSARLALPIPEAAAAAGVSRGTLYNEIKSGRLKPTKIRRRTVILHAELLRWLSECGK
jgi:excisionase family DNA binding protein